jgi:hypothetical protein
MVEFKFTVQGDLLNTLRSLKDGFRIAPISDNGFVLMNHAWRICINPLSGRLLQSEGGRGLGGGNCNNEGDGGFNPPKTVINEAT